MATKSKPDDRLLIGQVADLQRDLFAAVEAALIREAEGDDVSDDLPVLLAATGWDDRRIKSERSRAVRIATFRKQAGTAAERDAARVAAERIATETADRRRELQTQIASLTAELRGLDGAESAAAAKVAGMEYAVERLRDDAPEHIKREANIRRAAARDRYARTIASYQTDIQHHDTLAGMPRDKLIKHLRMVPGMSDCLDVQRDEHQGAIRTIRYDLNEAGFRRYLASLDADRKREELPGLREAYDAALAEADAMLDYYV